MIGGGFAVHEKGDAVSLHDYAQPVPSAEEGVTVRRKEGMSDALSEQVSSRGGGKGV